jgi:Fur family transcriptional regulator, peroxide stress response regulator
MDINYYKNKLTENSLKVTPQRLAVIEALLKLNNHPTAENIIDYIRKAHPNIATGTVYKVLDTLSEKNIIKKVKTDKGVMRYDGIMEKHHHLYCAESDRIEDFFDEELNILIGNYFRKKKIKNFKIEDVKLQIIGKFTTK